MTLQQIVHIPTVNDEPEDFAKLFHIWQQVKDNSEDIKFDFSKCGFLRPNAVAFLGGLARFIESRALTVVFDWDSCKSTRVMENLRKNGFVSVFNHAQPIWEGNSIPYREDQAFDPNEIWDYLNDSWLGRGGWVRTTEKLRNVIVGKMWEIYHNAFAHSGTGIGVFSCGQFFPKGLLKNNLNK